MKNTALQKGLIFGILMFVFNILYQYFINDNSGWKLFVASLAGGLVGGAVFGGIEHWKYKKQNRE